MQGDMHTHRGMPVIDGWGNPSCVRNAMQKNGEDNRKVEKTNQIVSQTFTPWPEHDKL